MTKTTFSILLTLLICFFYCKESKPENKRTEAIIKSIPSAETTKQADESLAPFETDTATINKKRFVLSVFKNDSTQYFRVEKEYGGHFKPILVDSDYTTNNSDLFFKDENKDGYLDIVWTKKWQDHSYLFNPQKDNFYEVGEFHDVDTLKINKQPILYKNKYPLLYLQNSEKDIGWMTELHSELFIIDSIYEKISFATIDNFASLEEWNIKKCGSTESVVVNCYIPPYFGKYGEISIWNSGRSVDSIFMKANRFDSSFITKYWTNNYKRLLQYGQVFKVRRDTELKYY